MRPDGADRARGAPLSRCISRRTGWSTARKADAYRYSPATPALDAAVRALTKVYNERPVTLVRMIYAPKDEKIRSFADAFRLKKP